MRPDVLIVDDDRDLARSLREYLDLHQLRAQVESNGRAAVEKILETDPGLVVLDLNLMGEDGLNVCRRVRRSWAGPILMWSARCDEVDQVVGLEVGADDYLSKPCSLRLLLAHIQALLRRSRRAAPSPPPATGPLRLSASTREAWLRGQPLDLTTAEFDLLQVFMDHAGEVLSRQDLIQAVRGIDYDGLDRSIDVRVSRLRNKLGDDPERPTLIKTVRGSGYLLVTPRS